VRWLAAGGTPTIAVVAAATGTVTLSAPPIIVARIESAISAWKARIEAD
jgi:hypothetical protein